MYGSLEGTLTFFHPRLFFFHPRIFFSSPTFLFIRDFFFSSATSFFIRDFSFHLRLLFFSSAIFFLSATSFFAACVKAARGLTYTEEQAWWTVGLMRSRAGNMAAAMAGEDRRFHGRRRHLVVGQTRQNLQWMYGEKIMILMLDNLRKVDILQFLQEHDFYELKTNNTSYKR